LVCLSSLILFTNDKRMFTGILFKYLIFNFLKKNKNPFHKYQLEYKNLGLSVKEDSSVSYRSMIIIGLSKIRL